MALESPIRLLCLLWLLCGPSKQGKTLTLISRMVCFRGITRETAVHSRSPLKPDGAVKPGCDLRTDGRTCTLLEHAPVCSVTFGGLSGAFTSRAVSDTGGAPCFQSCSIGSETGPPEPPEGFELVEKFTFRPRAEAAGVSPGLETHLS